MATLNTFVWDLYRSSVDGALAVAYFEALPTEYADNAGFTLPNHAVTGWVESQMEEPQFVWEHPGPLDEETRFFIEAVRQFAEARTVGTPGEVEALLTALVTSGKVQLSSNPDDLLDVDVAMDEIILVSLGLHLAHPEVFVPYAFKGEHYLLTQIAAAFGIPLPAVPPKNDRLGRWLYYAHFSAALQEFRHLSRMSMPELLAFLNHFAVLYVLTEGSDELPEPRHAWLLVGGGEEDGDFGELEVVTPEEALHWQGSLDMRRGDVCVMYVRSPIAAVHSLCRVVEDAYEDPFFHYKHAVQIGRVQRVPRVPFRELAQGAVMAQSQHIRRNLQGTSGQLLTRAEYQDILGMLGHKGFDVSTAPRLPDVGDVDLSALGNERDVELVLVEPLLQRLGLQDDWVRQLPVRMGRGERIYPDYVLGLTGTFPEQRVRALVEVKYRAPGDRAWREAFLQAKSYALRLGAKTMVVAAAEGLQLYERRNDDFSFERGVGYSWADLQQERELLNLRQALEA